MWYIEIEFFLRNIILLNIIRFSWSHFGYFMNLVWTVGLTFFKCQAEDIEIIEFNTEEQLWEITTTSNGQRSIYISEKTIFEINL